MTSFSLNLPNELKEQAQKCADNQGITLQTFMLLALAEKIGLLNQPKNDGNFPGITYVAGVSGVMQPVIKGTRIRVQTLVIAAQNWGLSVAEIADDYELKKEIVEEAILFYQTHKTEIENLINSEAALELIYK